MTHTWSQTSWWVFWLKKLKNDCQMEIEPMIEILNIWHSRLNIRQWFFCYFRVLLAWLGMPKNIWPHITEMIGSICSYHQYLTTYKRLRQSLYSFWRYWKFTVQGTLAILCHAWQHPIKITRSICNFHVSLTKCKE